VSLIESAIEKLRRGGEAGALPGVRAPRMVSVAATAAKAPPVAVAAKPTAEAEERAKRVKVDLRALRDAGYLPEEGLERRFADHYRQIKRPLIEKALAGNAEMRHIMISSALPGDGKTFTSINLALSIAREHDASVLLIDADAPKARVSEVFGLRGEPGLLEALADPSLDVESLIQGTNVRGLEILPAGKFVEHATELLASARMGELAARLGIRNSRRLVLFDSVPLLVSSEARVLMRICGQIVLVARVGATPRRALADAVSQVDRTKLQGLILNHAPVRQTGHYTYGYFGYGAAGEGPTDGG
jgi:protein-tyrosine kinase